MKPSSLQYLQCMLGFIIKKHREKYPFCVLQIESGTPEHPFISQFLRSLGLAQHFFSATYKHAHYLNTQS